MIRTQSYKGTLIEKELLGEKIIRDWMQGFIREKRKRSRQGLSEETHSHILRMTTTLLCEKNRKKKKKQTEVQLWKTK